MSAERELGFDFLCQRAGLDLSPTQQIELQRLVKVLCYGGAFRMLFVEISEAALQNKLIERLNELLTLKAVNSAQLDLGRANLADVAALQDWLQQAHGQGARVIHLTHGDAWLDDSRLEALNLRRESLAHNLACKLVFWLPTALLNRVAQRAADLWSWRSGVYSLLPESDATPPSWTQETPASGRTVFGIAGKARRVGALRQMLAQPLDDEDALPLWDELATLLADLGESDEALTIRRKRELPVYQKLGDVRSEAVTQSQIADILQGQGLLDEALAIRREQLLPVFQKLGDVRSEAVTYGQIADILQGRGSLDEALVIHRERVLPVFQKLGDVRSEAITHSRIADILQARGSLDEALTIRRERELPVFQKLGDVREEAIAHGKIADILQKRGSLDEALVIRRERQLPVFQKLGDVRLEAVTHGKIADILQVRGSLDEALAIRRERELPVYQKLGDVRAEAITHGKIADILQVRGSLDEALAIRQERELPVYQKLGNMREEAMTKSKIALIVAAQGQPAQALATLQETLAVFRRLGERPTVQDLEKRIAALQAAMDIAARS